MGKEKQKLITTSLISSIDWYQNSPASWKDRAYKDLSDTLNRVWGTPSEAIQHGMAFEKKVYEIAKKYQTESDYMIQGSNEFRMVVEKCIGGTFQDKLKCYEVIHGESYFLYGKTDVMLEKMIIDLKTTGTFKEEKYTKSFQHKLYMYMAHKSFFEYLVVEWDKYPKIKEVHSIDITAEPITYVDEIHEKIHNAMEFLKSRPILWKAYREKYCLY